jgi:hypothetical protein
MVSALRLLTRSLLLAFCVGITRFVLKQRFLKKNEHRASHFSLKHFSKRGVEQVPVFASEHYQPTRAITDATGWVWQIAFCVL